MLKKRFESISRNVKIYEPPSWHIEIIDFPRFLPVVEKLNIFSSSAIAYMEVIWLTYGSVIIPLHRDKYYEFINICIEIGLHGEIT